MKNAEPITALRDVTRLEEDLKLSNGELPIAKNGKIKFYVLSPEQYEDLRGKKEAEESSIKKLNSEPLQIDDLTEDPAMGFCRVAAATHFIHLGNPDRNANEIIETGKSLAEKDVSLIVFPELSLTGYTSGDLFLDDALWKAVVRSLAKIIEASRELKAILVVGAPFRHLSRIYNCAFVIIGGRLLGIVPKTNLPNYAEFYEARHFSPAPKVNQLVRFLGNEVPFGSRLVFIDSSYPKLQLAAEICEDLWVPNSPSSEHVLAGATVIANLSASNEIVGKADYRRRLVSMASAKQTSAYVYADAGDGESTSDLVFAGHGIIAENGRILKESGLFAMENAVTDIDLELIDSERRKNNCFNDCYRDSYVYVPFKLPLPTIPNLLREYEPHPFMPAGNIDLKRVDSILDMQAEGLKNRLRAVKAKKAVVGLSGGLDSTLALLVGHLAFQKAGLDKKDLIAITMPCFGTSQRTHDNAVLLAQSLGISFREINISKSIQIHLNDIGHGGALNTAYENAQARERTQVLMDIANDIGGLMIGTGDLSELCLGWCTYNGDHMSMYGVNASIPKTLVRYLVRGYSIEHPETSKALDDILDTPISPELLPLDEEGAISQVTEDKIGPYELHDFFLYYHLRFHFRPQKVFFLAKHAFASSYSTEEIKKWLLVFYRRFYASQFKRNCLPDGPKVGTVAVSPRGDLRLPSDADAEIFISEAESL